MSSSPTETLIDVTMPQMGVSVAEGTILEWLKQPGDWVEADEIIASISTDKIDTDVEAPAGGRVQEILVANSDGVHRTDTRVRVNFAVHVVATTVTLSDGSTRTFLEDGDTVVMRAWCEAPGRPRLGFGEVRGTVLPARSA